jgi:hypothetical protein
MCIGRQENKTLGSAVIWPYTDEEWDWLSGKNK